MGQPKTESQSVSLDGLFGHLSASCGLYSRETFVSLCACVVRLIRQYQLQGLVFYHTLNDPEFDTLAMAVSQANGITGYGLKSHELPTTPELEPGQTGFFVALTNQLCATVYWSTASQGTYRMYQGGWTFHPGDSKTLALAIVQGLEDASAWMERIERTPLDRRYDEKVTSFITQLIDNLESRNRALTLALNQVQTLNARIVDQERLAAIGQLCSVIAHEIRNPLGLIDLYAKLVENQVSQWPHDSETGNKDTLQKNLQLIRQATQNLEGILSELTNYARPLTLEPAEQDLGQLVQDTAAFFKPQFDEKGVSLTVEVPDEPLPMPVDARRLQQALLNILKNALEASSAKTTVHVRLAGGTREQPVSIRVSDEGTGIDAGLQAKLFTPYFSTKGNGTGLGLAHSRKILQAHGGTLTLVESSPAGTTFALTLPLPGSIPQMEGPNGKEDLHALAP